MKLVTALLAIIAAPALFRVAIIAIFLMFIFAGSLGSGFVGWSTSGVMVFIIGYLALHWLRSGGQRNARRNR